MSLRGSLSSEYGAYKKVKARFWPLLSGESPQNALRCSHVARKPRGCFVAAKCVVRSLHAPHAAVRLQRSPSLSLSLSLSLSVSHPLSRMVPVQSNSCITRSCAPAALSPSLSVFRSLSLSLSISLHLSLSLSPPPSLSHTHTQSLTIAVCRSVSLYVSLSVCLSLSMVTHGTCPIVSMHHTRQCACTTR